MLDAAIGKQPLLETVSVCEAGPIHKRNEDRVAIVAASDHNLPGKGTLFIVADGMGGMNSGEKASEIVVTELPTLYLQSPAANSLECLVESFVEVNRKVYEESERLPAGETMGSTVVASVILGEWLITANVGDSRAYLVHEGRIRQLTRDHSLRKKFFSPFLTTFQDYSHVLTQAIGPRATVSPHINVSKLEEGDTILLCSDGLTAVLTDGKINDILQTHPPTKAVEHLMANVVAKEGDDDVSIIVSKVVKVPTTSEVCMPL
jgi:protein phosphatase